MSSSYAYVRIINDDAAFIAYISKSLPTVTSVTDTSTGISISFSSPLTGPQQTTLTALVSAYPDIITGVVDQVQLSTYNHSIVPLTGAATYTGAWEDVSRFTSVVVSALSDKGSSTLGLVVQFGVNSPQVDTTRTYTVAAGVNSVQHILVPGRYVRVLYTNGATAQVSFNLQLKYTVGHVPTTVDGTVAIDDTMSAALQRNLTMARSDIGTYAHVRADEDRRIRVRTSTESAVVAREGYSPIVQATYTYSINSDTSNTTLVTGGTVTQSTNCALLSTSAAAASSASLTTRRYVGCGAGRVVRIVIAGAFSTGVAGSTQIAGIGTNENGLFVGYNGTAFGVMVRSNSVDSWTPATAFNIDRLNGTGASGIILDATKGNVYTLTYDSTGFGGVQLALASTPALSAPEAVAVHRIAFGNSAILTGLRNFSGPLLATVANTTNTTALSIRIASFSAFTDGVPRMIGGMRGADITKTVLATTNLPLLSILNKTTFQTITNCLSVYLRQLSISSDGTKGSVIVSIYDNASLTGASYSDISTSNSTVQVDNAATAMTGGILITSFVLFNKSNQMVDLAPYDISVSPGSVITLAAKCSTVAVSNIVTAAIGWSEDI